MSDLDLTDETAQVLREAIMTEALSDSPSPFVLGRMLDTYGHIFRSAGALDRPIGAERYEGGDELTETLADATGVTPEEIEEGAADIDIEPPEEAVVVSEQSSWRDIEPPEDLSFDTDEYPHGTEIIVEELFYCHHDEYCPPWAVYMGVLDRFPDVPGEYVEFDELHSAADPWTAESAHVALEDLSAPTEGCFAVHAEESRHSDTVLYAITQVGQAINEWWRGEKYNALRID